MRSAFDGTPLPPEQDPLNHPAPQQVLQPHSAGGGSYLDNVARHSYRLGLRYDGTAYRGWQLQPGFPTIQCAIEHALTVGLSESRERLLVCAAGRTDSGVHAMGQVRAPDQCVGWEFIICQVLQVVNSVNIIIIHDEFRFLSGGSVLLR